jgi:hypothetical protein
MVIALKTSTATAITYTNCCGAFLIMEQFYLDARKLSLPEDYKANYEKLIEIKPHLREAFLGCLKLGGRIIPSIKATELIEKISIESPLQPMDCISLASKFRWLNELIDMKPD